MWGWRKMKKIIWISWTEKIINFEVLMTLMMVDESMVAGTEWAGWAVGLTVAHPGNNLGGHCPTWILSPCK